MRTLKRLAGVTAAVALATTMFAAPATPAAAGTSAGSGDSIIVPLTDCGTSRTVTIGPVWSRTAKAFWRVNCSAGTISVSGWVEDLKSDGLCARVKALIGSTWHYSPRACPKGNVKDFTLSGRSNNDEADVFLFVEA